jgi:hypothetical protein
VRDLDPIKGNMKEIYEAVDKIIELIQQSSQEKMLGMKLFPGVIPMERLKCNFAD